MNKINFLFLAVFLLFSQNNISAQTKSAEETAKSPVAQRINEWVQSVNTGDWAAMEKYAEATYAGRYREYPTESHLQVMQDLYYKSRNLEIYEIKEASPHSANATLKNKLTEGWIQLLMEVEPAAPHGIVRVGWGTADPPTEYKSNRSLTEIDLIRELDVYFTRLARADVYSGVVLLAKNDRILYQKGFGEANKNYSVANQPDTKFNLASIPKMFTAVAVAQLVEAGKLSFEDSVHKFLPDLFPKETGQKIKIKHLLSHTSGLGNYLDKMSEAPRRRQPRLLPDYLEFVKGETPAFEPGSGWRYSNSGFLILGVIVEKLSDKSYFRYVRENIFEPAAMKDTGFFDAEWVIKNQAVGYEKQFTADSIRYKNNVLLIGGGNGSPAGGGYSIAADLLKFFNALSAGKLLGAPLVKILQTAKPELASPDYGYGFFVNTNLNSAGHSGGFSGVSNNSATYFDTGYTLITLSNYGGATELVQAKLDALMLAVNKKR
ncbi:MAG TPA: serine hydrolase domain-containing protein [Pyrinomonadaceae bacterium]|jgi:CubicO group peptidase (beta-lactamase class C family)